MATPQASRADPVCFSIPEFCAAHNISESFYFKLKSEGLGPVEMEVGKRRLISAEAAAAWRKARERGMKS